MNPWIEHLLLAGVGVFAGIINTVAGGGSLLTVPLLIFCGLPPTVANATNRIAIFFQNIPSIRGFYKAGVLDLKLGTLLAIPAAIGSVYGAHLAITVDPELFQRIFGLVILLCTAFVVLKPKFETTRSKRRLSLGLLLFLFIGVYGGFIQAGVGFLMIAVTAFVLGQNLARSNALKVYVTFIYTIVAIGLFARADLIDWPKSISLSVGNMVGSYFGVRWAMSEDMRLLRMAFVVCALVISVKLIFF